ncbi:MAG: uncharacterized protein KVP18_002487 [Porospora cf. gigantea A]|uniref:uncharacterized protein n=1 Tax=Porospora cf. gigantea A TaxID=2853593 RepID=UPI003559B8BC|nr:MAG: hypothetical protein KVP18_002487 [Porospora cf. gigantea A]
MSATEDIETTSSEVAWDALLTRKAALTAFLQGFSSLLPFFMVLNSQVAFEDSIWPDSVMSDILGGAAEGGNLLACLALASVGSLAVRPVIPLTASAVLTVAVLCFPLVPQLLPGTANETAALAAMAVFNVVIGGMGGALSCHGYQWAGQVSPGSVAWVSTGIGASGVASFFTFLFFSEVVFPKASVVGQQQLVWTLFAIGSLAPLATNAAVLSFSKSDLFLTLQLNTRLTHSTRSEFVVVLRDCFPFCAAIFFHFFITMSLFPVIGPYSWSRLSYTSTTIINGVFQVTDMTSRWLPRSVPALLLSRRATLLLFVLRPLVFVPLFVVPARLPDLDLLNNAVFQGIVMLLFAFIHGIGATVGAVHTIDSVTTPQDKQLAACLMTISVTAGVTVGMFSSKMYLL